MRELFNKLKQVMEQMDFEFDVVDSTNDSKTSSESEEEEKPDELYRFFMES